MKFENWDHWLIYLLIEVFYYLFYFSFLFKCLFVINYVKILSENKKLKNLFLLEYYLVYMEKMEEYK